MVLCAAAESRLTKLQSEIIATIVVCMECPREMVADMRELPRSSARPEVVDPVELSGSFMWPKSGVPQTVRTSS